MGSQGKATWSNNKNIFNFSHIWLGWAVGPLSHLSYNPIFGIINYAIIKCVSLMMSYTVVLFVILPLFRTSFMISPLF